MPLIAGWSHDQRAPKPYGVLFFVVTNTTGALRLTNLEWTLNQVGRYRRCTLYGWGGGTGACYASGTGTGGMAVRIGAMTLTQLPLPANAPPHLCEWHPHLTPPARPVSTLFYESPPAFLQGASALICINLRPNSTCYSPSDFCTGAAAPGECVFSLSDSTSNKRMIR